MLAGLGDFGFMAKISPVSAAESKLRNGMVQFRPEIEPLVRLLEETPRAALLEEIGSRVRRGLSYREVLTALLLAGIRNVQPRPVGFKFHAVLVINSAHMASIQSPDERALAAHLLGTGLFQGSTSRGPATRRLEDVGAR